MKESYIKKIVRILEDSSVDTIQISSLWGFNKIRISKSSNATPNEHIPAAPPSINTPSATKPPAQEEQSTAIQEPLDSPLSKEEHPNEDISFEEKENIHHITAPLVGTFYLTPNPDDPPFVKKGDKIVSGQVICIIEAMKIFNDIESEVSGVVHEVLVDNASPVEYGQNIISIILDD